MTPALSSTRLFVGSLPWETTESELKNYFDEYGSVTDVSIPVDRDTGRSKGFGFIEFSSPSEADEALAYEHSMGGRKLIVNFAKARENKPREGRYRERGR